MGQTWSSFYSYWFPNREYKLVVVGLDNAGKTTTLYRLHLGQAVTTHPTVGSNVEQITFRNLQFEVRRLQSWQCLTAACTEQHLLWQVWDLGGQANLRPSWQTYYRAANAVIMVVDSTDRARVGIAKVSSCVSQWLAVTAWP